MRPPPPCWACFSGLASSGFAFFSCCALFSSCFAGFSGCAFFSAGLSFCSSCCSCCSCCAYTGAARVKDRAAVPITPSSLMSCCLHCLSIDPLPAIPLLQASRSRIDRVADGVAGHKKLHSPVLLPAGGVIVGGYRQSVAEAFCADGIARYAFLHQVIAHRSGPVLRQGLIHGIAADVIGISADFNVESRICQQNAGDFCQLLPRTRLQRKFPGVKQNIGHTDDQPARAVASLTNGIPLLRQFRAHGRFVGLRLLRAQLRLLCRQAGSLRIRLRCRECSCGYGLCIGRVGPRFRRIRVCLGLCRLGLRCIGLGLLLLPASVICLLLRLCLCVRGILPFVGQAHFVHLLDRDGARNFRSLHCFAGDRDERLSIHVFVDGVAIRVLH